MDAGVCFFNKAAPGIPSHPWIIISDPALDPENVVIVNLTDAETHNDHTCVLTPADVPWVTKNSCVAYQFAKLTTLSRLDEAESKGLLLNRQTVTEPILQRIREGAALSEETRNDHLEVLRSQGLA